MPAHKPCCAAGPIRRACVTFLALPQESNQRNSSADKPTPEKLRSVLSRERTPRCARQTAFSYHKPSLQTLLVFLVVPLNAHPFYNVAPSVVWLSCCAAIVWVSRHARDGSHLRSDSILNLSTIKKHQSAHPFIIITATQQLLKPRNLDLSHSGFSERSHNFLTLMKRRAFRGVRKENEVPLLSRLRAKKKLSEGQSPEFFFGDKGIVVFPNSPVSARLSFGSTFFFWQ